MKPSGSKIWNSGEMAKEVKGRDQDWICKTHYKFSSKNHTHQPRGCAYFGGLERKWKCFTLFIIT